MIKERALTLEALRVMDAIDRRGSFAAAADELGKVPSALSYTMQKLEDDLDVVLFDRSGHRTKFTHIGKILLERGRLILEASEKLARDVETLSSGWESRLTLVCDALVPYTPILTLIEQLSQQANTQILLMQEVLAGVWEKLEQGMADIAIAPSNYLRPSSEINSSVIGRLKSVYVAHPDHPVHTEPEPLADASLLKYCAVAIADTAKERPPLTAQLLDKQRRLTVSTIEMKKQALLMGLGIGTMPINLVNEEIKSGKLKVIAPDFVLECDIAIAWRRDSIGEAKFWMLRRLPKLFNYL